MSQASPTSVTAILTPPPHRRAPFVHAAATRTRTPRIPVTGTGGAPPAAAAARAGMTVGAGAPAGAGGGGGLAGGGGGAGQTGGPAPVSPRRQGGEERKYDASREDEALEAGRSRRPQSGDALVPPFPAQWGDLAEGMVVM